MPLLEMIERTCQRPQLFTSAATFKGLADFLSGYDCAMTEFTPELERVGLGEFGFWFSYKAGFPENIPVNLTWWGKIERTYPDDAEAFEQVPRLYCEFLKDREQGLWPPSLEDQGE